MLVEGTWQIDPHVATNPRGEFNRPDSGFRDWIRADGSTAHPPARGRYHLYISVACPWAHRTRIFRLLKRLDAVISVSGVEPLMLEHGWAFSERYPDPLFGSRYLYEVYQRADPGHTGRVTVPVLYDRETDTIVNNESSEIIRMLNRELDAFTDNRNDYYPESLRPRIDQINDRVYRTINNGVYRCGFSRSQEAYDHAVGELFDSLDWLEELLADQSYLAGDRVTEADWRFYTTAIRFDPVYHYHFKCNVRRLRDYPRLFDLTRRLHQQPGIAELFDVDYTKRHYFGSHPSINPTGIVPAGPAQLLA